MAEYLIQSETLDDIADAIIKKTGTYGETMTPAQMVTAIGSISGEVQHFSYTQAEDWLTGSVGNSGTLVSAYCTHGDGLYVINCSGNNATQKRFDYAVVAILSNTTFGNTQLIYSVRDASNTSSGAPAVSRDLFITAGAVLNVDFNPWGGDT